MSPMTEPSSNFHHARLDFYHVQGLQKQMALLHSGRIPAVATLSTA